MVPVRSSSSGILGARQGNAWSCEGRAGVGAPCQRDGCCWGLGAGSRALWLGKERRESIGKNWLLRTACQESAVRSLLVRTDCQESLSKKK